MGLRINQYIHINCLLG